MTQTTTDDGRDPMRGILIDPTTRTVKEVMVPKEGNHAISGAISCDWITCTQVSASADGFGDDLWVDDEGLLVQPNPNGYFKLGPHLFAGKGLILAHDPEGNSISTSLPVALVFLSCRFLTFDQLTPEEIEPKMTFVALDDNLQPVPGTEQHIPLRARKDGEP